MLTSTITVLGEKRPKRTHTLRRATIRDTPHIPTSARKRRKRFDAAGPGDLRVDAGDCELLRFRLCVAWIEPYVPNLHSRIRLPMDTRLEAIPDDVFRQGAIVVFLQHEFHNPSSLCHHCQILIGGHTDCFKRNLPSWRLPMFIFPRTNANLCDGLRIIVDVINCWKSGCFQ